MERPNDDGLRSVRATNTSIGDANGTMLDGIVVETDASENRSGFASSEGLQATEHAAEDSSANTMTEPETESSATDVHAVRTSPVVVDNADGDPLTLEKVKGLESSVLDLKRAAGVDTTLEDHAPKPKRVRKTREEKIAILQFVDDGGTHVAAAERFGVSRTAVTKMVKERDIILAGIANVGQVDVGAAVAAMDAIGVSSNGTEEALNGVVATEKVVETVVAPSSSALSLDIGALAGTPTRRSLSTPKKIIATTLNGRSETTMPSASKSASTVEKPKARRVRKTNEEKLQILEFVERGGSQGAAAEKFGVSRTAVTKMVKEKDAISKQVQSGMSHHRKVLQYQHKLSVIEDMLYKWQLQIEQDAPNLKITGDLLQSKAMEFRDKILSEIRADLQPEVIQSLTDFKASNGWLHRYMQRRNLRSAARRDEQQPVPSLAITQGFELYLQTLRQHLAGVPASCIWNLDKLALLPRRLSPIAADTNIDRTSTERLTIALMVNAVGERFKLQVIGEGSGVNKPDELLHAQDAVVFVKQAEACQDTITLSAYLHVVNAEAKVHNQIWYILVDASPLHVSFAHLVDPAGSLEHGFRFESLVLCLLPSETSIGEPLPVRRGISRAFKTAFRSFMVTALRQRFLIWRTQSDAGTSSTGFDLLANTQMKDVLDWIVAAWESVPASLIRQAWAQHSLLSQLQLSEVSQELLANVTGTEILRSLTEVLNQVVTQPEIGTALGIDSIHSDAIIDTSQLASAIVALDDAEPTERKVDFPPEGVMLSQTNVLV